MKKVKRYAKTGVKPSSRMYNCRECGIDSKGPNILIQVTDRLSNEIVYFCPDCWKDFDKDEMMEELDLCFFERGREGDVLGRYPTEKGLLVVFPRGGPSPAPGELWDIEFIRKNKRGNVGFVRPVKKICSKAKRISRSTHPSGEEGEDYWEFGYSGHNNRSGQTFQWFIVSVSS
jgi:DNA-directed RNA polymerase subunit RPC12/RpoP